MYGLQGFFFENCTDFFENCTDFFKTNVRIFSKIVRIVRISSENVRIFCTDGFKKVLATLNCLLGHPVLGTIGFHQKQIKCSPERLMFAQTASKKIEFLPTATIFAT